MKRFRIVCLITAVLVAVLAGCGSSHSPAEQSSSSLGDQRSGGVVYADQILENLVKGFETDGANILGFTAVKDGNSMSKSIRQTVPCQDISFITAAFTATAVGIAQDRGLLSVEDSVLNYLKDSQPEKIDSKWKDMTIHHLLSCTMGNDKAYTFSEDPDIYEQEDWAAYLFSKPLDWKPGQKCAWSDGAYYLLSRILHEVTGMTLGAFVRDNLFTPMSIKDYAWAKDASGETLGGTGLYLPSDDLAKLGTLYMMRGKFAGKQLVSAEFVQAATQNQGPEGAGFGYGFWVRDKGFECRGLHQQVLLIKPESKLILAAYAYMTEPYDYWSVVDESA